MRSTLGARALAVATATALTFTTFATAASAEEAATLTLGEAGVLTLPAGDGVRDTTPVSVESDVATTADVAVRQAGGGAPVVTLAPITFTEPLAPVTVDVPIDGLLTAGAYELVVTPAVGEPTVTPLTVGSGDPVDVSLSLSARTLFTWSGASPRTAVATVSATDETGLTVPFTGTVVAKAGGKTSSVTVTSTTGAAATPKVYASKLAAGTGTVTAKLNGPTLLGSTASVPLTIKKTAITGVSLGTSLATVYPAKDGYRDSVKLTVTPAKSRATTFPATGVVKVTYQGKTVKSWRLTSATKWTGTWGGLNGGRIVPGTYKVSVSVKGPEGATQSASRYVSVSKKKLVTKTLTKTYDAAAVLTRYEAYDSSGNGICYHDWAVPGDIRCFGYVDAYGEDLSLIAKGKVAVPSAVISAERFGGASVKLTTEWSFLKSDSFWCYDTVAYGCTKNGETALGKQTLGALKLPATSKTVHVGLGLSDNAKAGAKTVTARYTYKVLA